VSCLVTLGCVAVFLFVVDRMLIWCELRGWISYRLTPRPMHTAIGNTLLAIEEMYRPSRRHVIEMRVEEAVQREEDDDGAGRAGDADDAAVDRPGPRDAMLDQQGPPSAHQGDAVPLERPAGGFLWGDPKQEGDDPKSPD